MFGIIYSFWGLNSVCHILDPFISLSQGDELASFGPGINSSVS